MPEQPSRRDVLPSAEDLGRLWNLTAGLLAVAADDGRVVHANRAWEQVLGWTVDELVGRAFTEYLHPEDVEATFAVMASSKRTGIRDFENRYRTREGEWRTLSWRAEHHDGQWYCIAHDTTRRQQLEQDVLRDPLTGVLNRAACLDRLAHALARAERGHGPVAVLFLDLDGFKSVNDSLGHAVGDAVLAAVARALDDVLRRADSLARLGGDEFVVLAESLAGGDADVEALVERICDAVRTPISVKGGTVTLGVSVGVVVAHGGSAAEILGHADVALYQAKLQGRNTAVWFDETLREEVEDRLELASDLRGAIARREFRVHYQPLVSLSDEAIVGCEALVRWQHPTRGLLKPDAFLGVAQDDGTVVEIGAWVLEQACRQQRRWRLDGTDVAISVNVATRELADPGYAERVADILARTGVPPVSLALEVAETALVRKTSHAAESLAALKALGVRIVLDDFGRGGSSLEHLKALSVDVIKVDRAFVRDVADDDEDRAIVAAVVALAQTTGRTVIAEGIEDQVQLGELRALGCPLGQGHYFSPAVPANDLVLDGFVPLGRPGIGDPTVIREFMRQIGIPARIR